MLSPPPAATMVQGFHWHYSSNCTTPIHNVCTDEERKYLVKKKPAQVSLVTHSPPISIMSPPPPLVCSVWSCSHLCWLFPSHWITSSDPHTTRPLGLSGAQELGILSENIRTTIVWYCVWRVWNFCELQILNIKFEALIFNSLTLLLISIGIQQ